MRDKSGVYIRAGKWRPPGRLQFLAMRMAVVTGSLRRVTSARSSKAPRLTAGSQAYM